MTQRTRPTPRARPGQTPPTRQYLTTEEVAERYRTVSGTVRYWRYIGKGPKGIKVGRQVLYALDEVERWEREQAGAVSGEPSRA
jgi:hypothetical protein